MTYLGTEDISIMSLYFSHVDYLITRWFDSFYKFTYGLFDYPKSLQYGLFDYPTRVNMFIRLSYKCAYSLFDYPTRVNMFIRLSYKCAYGLFDYPTSVNMVDSIILQVYPWFIHYTSGPYCWHVDCIYALAHSLIN